MACMMLGLDSMLLRLLCAAIISAVIMHAPQVSSETLPAKPSLSEVELVKMRELATQYLEELRFLDAAVDQWAIENNPPPGAKPMPADVARYVKPGTRLNRTLGRGECEDLLGNKFEIPAEGEPPKMPRKSFEYFSGVIRDDYWYEYAP
jgi:hypothetical protein